MVITKEVAIDFIKTNIVVIIAAVVIIVYALYIFIRQHKKNKAEIKSIDMSQYEPKKRGRKAKSDNNIDVKDEIVKLTKDLPVNKLESELRTDMAKWMSFNDKLNERRNEILETNAQLKEELARIDLWRRFINDVFSKVGKEEKN